MNHRVWADVCRHENGRNGFAWRWRLGEEVESQCKMRDVFDVYMCVCVYYVFDVCYVPYELNLVYEGARIYEINSQPLSGEWISFAVFLYSLLVPKTP